MTVPCWKMRMHSTTGLLSCWKRSSRNRRNAAEGRFFMFLYILQVLFDKKPPPALATPGGGGGETHMRMTNLTDFCQNLPSFLKQASQEEEVIRVGTEDGGVVVMSEDAYRGLVETLELLRVPGMREKLAAGMETPLEECDDFEW